MVNIVFIFRQVKPILACITNAITSLHGSVLGLKLEEVAVEARDIGLLLRFGLNGHIRLMPLAGQ